MAPNSRVSRIMSSAAAAGSALLLALAIVSAQHPAASPAPRTPSFTLTRRAANDTASSNATDAALASAAALRAAALPPPAAAAAGGSNTSAACPPANFSGVPDLDVLAYIAAPWFVQKQLPLDYQPPDELFCVKAEYQLRNPANVSEGLVVNNYANRGGVNGPHQGSSKYDRSANASRLIALPDDTPDASDGKLLVGPEALLAVTLPAGGSGGPFGGGAPAGRKSNSAAAVPLWRAAFGPYWVVAVGPSQNATLKYDWAIISGGAPAYPGLPDLDTGKPLCTTMPPGGLPANATSLLYPAAGANATAAAGSMRQRREAVAALGRAAAQPPGRSFDVGGLWFFSRNPVDPNATATMEKTARSLGLDTSRLLVVPQQGCTYSTST
ncbi:hypothetical protein HYH02_001336 [Chlamydomonas schloesseri]|uniref:Uncharacterized protein n=1 Tax=Chlamydomonas schloesseri TaxID=2026947 RepID=A0A835WW75_9CHLO|nr:hypothetical protein HYH02_001336 [Chlamydomonas schloesseri]|eukprot:KAG2454308.1 hypothetical protein HYH02_001336 [Chlamydomonas schloesseri]